MREHPLPDLALWWCDVRGQPQDHSKKVNRKMYRAALQSIMSELARQDRLMVVESLDLEEPKTKLLAKQLGEYGLDNVLIVSAEVGENLYLASRNLHKVERTRCRGYGSCEPDRSRQGYGHCRCSEKD